MREVLLYLDERKSEFARHVLIAKSLEDRLDAELGVGEMRVEVRHINTLKSGLLIHLYNIVEAVMSRTLRVVGQTASLDAPKKWTAELRKEWVRSQIFNGEGNLGDAALDKLSNVSGNLASGSNLAPFTVKGAPGSWEDKKIAKVAQRLNCQLNINANVKRAACEPIYRNDKSAFEYLAGKRNAIAHGATTFEEGASELTLEEIKLLGDRVLPYLEATLRCFESYLTAKSYIDSGVATS